MKNTVKLYRIGFHASCPKDQSETMRFCLGGTMVGDWQEIIDALERHRQNFWTEVFSVATGRRIAGPFAPATQAESSCYVR